MNLTTASYFTFNVDNSLLLVGQTGTGKSILVDKYLERLVKAHTHDELKFILLDMTGVDFMDIRDKHPEYILEDLKFNAEEALYILERFVSTVSERVETGTKERLLVLCIEECDMAAIDQKRFDNALIKVNRAAKEANVKVIYSTSRPAPDVVSHRLIDSFDLILAGKLSDADYKHLGVQRPEKLDNYEFVVTGKN